MDKRKKVRKPRRLDKTNVEDRYIYAGFDKAKDCAVYIGGPYYQEGAQIHLSVAEVHDLAKWLNQASTYLKAKVQP